MDFNDYYDILEIDDSAAESEIKVAIRKTRSRGAQSRRQRS